jgi:hypothetical protein
VGCGEGGRGASVKREGRRKERERGEGGWKGKQKERISLQARVVRSFMERSPESNDFSLLALAPAADD